jgi:hypothetical protein
MRKLKIIASVLLVSAAALTLFIYLRGLKARYTAAVSRENAATPDMVGKIDAAAMSHLPAVVKKYLIVTRFADTDKIRNFRLVWDGALRSDAKSPWMSATMHQENFFHEYARDFYLTAIMKGLPVSVWHSYHNKAATMQVKIISLFPVVDLSGEELTKTETVTLFNDMCLMAPGALIDKRIAWKIIDSLRVEATLTNGQYRIKAQLEFNDKGELVNFISDDRSYLTPENMLRRERWSTPITDYRDFGDRRLASQGEAIWHLKEGAYTYGKFRLLKIEYNVR